MSYDIITIKDGVNLHLINTDKFKTNLVSIFLTSKLQRKTVTEEALIPAILRLGSANINTQKELNKTLEQMYGADFNCGIEKRGDNHVLKFYIESINNEFALNEENLLFESVELLLDIVLNPYTENEAFSKKYLESEKENIKRIIEGKIDNKSKYAYTRCIEEMYKDESFGLYEYGYIEDLEAINEKNLYDYYQTLIQNCKIDIFISGNIENEQEIIHLIEKNVNTNKLKSRVPEYVQNSKEKFKEKLPREITENMDVTQGKIVMGLSIKNSNNEDAILNVYNAILGGGANSKLFQNVREKASLAYSAGSGYLKVKNNIFIKCGIEIKNYNETINIIKQQLEDMKTGNFSDKDINDSKELIIASLNSVKDEQSNEISYYLSQELSDNKINIEDFINQIENVKKEQIIDVANRVYINTIYFLKNQQNKI